MEWLTLGIFTIVLGVFVVPEGGSKSESFSALQVKDLTEVTAFLSLPFIDLLTAAFYYGKSLLKYVLVLAYLWLIFRKVDQYLKRRKLKKI
jgi:hypothetical protein